MTKPADIQKLLFEIIKARISPSISLVDEIASILSVSTDSAYRRIRGEKPVSIYEIEKLATSFNLSIDSLMGISEDSVTFQTSYLNEKDLNFKIYLKSLLTDMQKVVLDPDIEVIFQLNELNLYHVVAFPELLAFKIYFWSKSSMEFPSYQDKKFSLSILDDEILSLSSEISDLYVKLNTTELLTKEFLISLMKQIEFYLDSGLFENREDAIILCDRSIDLIEHLRKQAEVGYKFKAGINPPGFGGKFTIYSNSLTLVDNVILLGKDGQGISYITNGAINLLTTNNQEFYRRNLKMAESIMKRSSPISHSGERERNRFFNDIRDSVLEVRNSLV